MSTRRYLSVKCKSKKVKQFSGIQLKESFDSTSKYWCDDEKFRLLLRKGVYPYEYIDSCEKFNEGKLPSKKAFYSWLNMKGISDEDYKHAQQVGYHGEKDSRVLS